MKDIGRFSRDFQPKKRTFNLNQTIKQVSGLFEGEFAIRGILVKLALSPDCGDIVADPDEMEQLLLNLIKNAIEAMPQGGSLSIKTYPKHPNACIQIADSGVGISEENKEKIGTPFFTTRKEGTGLGLSICHKIINAHQGSLDIWSDGPGRGTVATVQIPHTPPFVSAR